VRTYSHALLTWAVAKRLNPSGPGVAAWGASGAVLPDLPAIAGAIWLGARRRSFTRRGFREDVCEKGSFGVPDAALHSAIPVGALLMLCLSGGVPPRGGLLTFLSGWAGHVLADALTHAEDARPILWPLSKRRFASPISYWDRSRYARTFTMLEHGTSLLLVTWTISRRFRAPRSSHSPSG
jgi:membrane-bound metal-dependent hydrolase YbcI (DUF457 family)